jgi:hypothetical protein
MDYVESLPASKLNELDPRKEVVSRSPFEQDDVDSTAPERLSRYVSDRPRETNRTVEPRRIESLQDAQRKSFSPSPALRLVQEVEHPHAVSLARIVGGTPIDLQAADRIGRL